MELATRTGTGRADAPSGPVAHAALGLRPLSLPELVVASVHVRASVLAELARAGEAAVGQAPAGLTEGWACALLATGVAAALAVQPASRPPRARVEPTLAVEVRLPSPAFGVVPAPAPEVSSASPLSRVVPAPEGGRAAPLARPVAAAAPSRDVAFPALVPTAAARDAVLAVGRPTEVVAKAIVLPTLALEVERSTVVAAPPALVTPSVPGAVVAPLIRTSTGPPTTATAPVAVER